MYKKRKETPMWKYLMLFLGIIFSIFVVIFVFYSNQMDSRDFIPIILIGIVVVVLYIFSKTLHNTMYGRGRMKGRRWR